MLVHVFSICLVVQSMSDSFNKIFKFGDGADGENADEVSEAIILTPHLLSSPLPPSIFLSLFLSLFLIRI